MHYVISFREWWYEFRRHIVVIQKIGSHSLKLIVSRLENWLIYNECFYQLSLWNSSLVCENWIVFFSLFLFSGINCCGFFFAYSNIFRLYSSVCNPIKQERTCLYTHIFVDFGIIFFKITFRALCRLFIILLVHFMGFIIMPLFKIIFLMPILFLTVRTPNGYLYPSF